MNRRINAIIVDDEKGCIANLHYMLTSLCPDIEVVGSGCTLAEGMSGAAGQKIDLAFLDVEIFDDNIFDILERMGGINVKVVFVTAYEQYALKAIKMEALDYVLKPLSEADILASYARIQKHFLPGLPAADSIEEPEDKHLRKHIVLRNLDKVYHVKCEDIYYMSGHGAYTEITFQAKEGMLSITICKVLNKIADEYDTLFFFRVHKSHVINLSKIQNVITTNGLHVQMADTKLIPVAKRRAHDFMLSLNNR